ncbi:hypothetical protein PybrP1_010457, partial [[Pythium] brassicae (nom. inval.)]
MNADSDASLKFTSTSYPIGADLSATTRASGSLSAAPSYTTSCNTGERVVAFCKGPKMLAGDPTLGTRGDSITLWYYISTAISLSWSCTVELPSVRDSQRLHNQ